MSDLNARVCRKMGIEPKRVTAWGGRAKYPNLLTPEWAGKLLEMLAARGVFVQVMHAPEYLNPWSIRIQQGEGPIFGEDKDFKTLAEAVCRAIDELPEVAGE